MKRVAVLIAEMFNESELIYPYYRLLETFKVDLVGKNAGEEYTSKGGVTLRADVASQDAKASDYDGVLIPGGFSPDFMRKDEHLKRFVREMDEAKKPIAAICHAGWMLASCCDLKGKTVTSTATIQDDMRHAGAEWVNEPLAVDGHLVTARMPADLPGFVLEFVRQLEEA